MDKEKLLRFIQSIPEFDTFGKSTMALNFGFFLQTDENYPKFTAQDINECFDVLDYEEPQNTKDLLNKLQGKGELISKKKGYRVKKQTADNLKNQILLHNTIRLERAFKPGQMYDFYKQIESICNSAKKEVFVIDAFANEDVIELYLDKLPSGVMMTVLTSKPQGNFMKIAQKFKQKHGSMFKVRTHKSCHDRLFFVDKTCYVIGQSIDKAAKDKPTYICEIEHGGQFRTIFQNLFNAGKTII